MTIPFIHPVNDDASRPLWSVLIPAYNPDPGYLRDAVESVLASGLDLSKSEIIVVDDGSTRAGINDLYAELSASGARVIRTENRVGLVNNWNRCLAASTGMFIHILHQDDRVLPGFYDAMHEGLQSGPGIGAAYSQVAFIDASGQTIRVGHLNQPHAGVIQDWVQHVSINLAIHCPGMVVARSVYEQIGGFNTSYQYCPDYDMWQRIAAEYPIWFSPEPLAQYRSHEESATHKIFELNHRWNERRRCFDEAALRMSAAVRDVARERAAYHRASLALAEALHVLRVRKRRVKGLLALVSLMLQASPVHLYNAVRCRPPTRLKGRAPERKSRDNGARENRMLLITEFAPHDTSEVDFGGFQRLRRTMESCDQAAVLDVLFIWINNFVFTEDLVRMHRERFMKQLPITGDVFMISPSAEEHADIRRYPLRTLYWLMRGVMSFVHLKPTIRSAGVRQIRELRDVLVRAQPDLILAHGLGSMAPLVRLGGSLPPVVLDFPDIEHVKLARIYADKKSLPDLCRKLIWRQMMVHAERTAMRHAVRTVVCSRNDQYELEKIGAPENVRILPNTATATGQQPLPGRSTALFVGIGVYPPNEQAIRWMISDVWPLVLRRMPDAKLVVAGWGTKELFSEGETFPGVEIAGFVEDLNAVYGDAQVSVCPILSGSGTRIKIIEAAFRGRPVVSTRIGAEGLAFEPGTEILLADTAEAFAESVVRLMGDPGLCESLAGKARARALEEYAPEKVVGKLAGWFFGFMADDRRAINAQSKPPYVFIGGTSEPGGLHVHTADVAMAVAAAGHETTIICPGVNYFSALCAGSSVRVRAVQDRLAGENIRAYWEGRLADFRGARMVLCRGKLGEGDPVDLAAIRSMASALYTIEHRAPDEQSGSVSAGLREMGRTMNRYAERVIAVSGEIADAARNQLHVADEKIAACVNWVDAALFVKRDGAKDRARTALGIPEDTFVIGYCGRLSPEKRVDVLIDAVAGLEGKVSRPYHLVLAGNGWKREELETQVESLGLGGRVTFTGWSPNPMESIAAFDCAVLPSLQEGFPLVLMEWMSAGLVCVAHAGMPAASELITSGENGLLADMGDAAHLCAALKDVLSWSGEDCEAMGTRAAATIHRSYTRVRRLPDVLRALDVDDVGRGMSGSVASRKSFAYQKPCVSVILPVYNRAAQLIKAAESVLAQSMRDFELLIIDDASTDDTLQTAFEIAARDDRVRVFENKGRHGPGAARNRGVKEARCDWIAFLDSDDTWAPGTLAHFCSGIADDVALVGGNYLMRDEATGQSQSMREFVENTMLPWWENDPTARGVINCAWLKSDVACYAAGRQIQLMTLGNFMWLSTPAVMVRRYFFDRFGGFNERLKRTEDMDLWLKIIMAGRVVYIDEVLAYVSMGGRDKGAGDRYQNYARKRRHNAYEGARYHLRFIRSLRKRMEMNEKERAFWSERVASGHKLCAISAAKKMSPTALIHYTAALLRSAKQRQFLREHGRKYFLLPW